jgi:2-succinyl-5-enolpyruvyl-6-hydroxy-3-cyclohexene-1-carboxylate synthase
MPGTDSYLGLRAFVDELLRCGVRDAVTSPGSRSTPLVLSLARSGLRATSHVDERSAAFFALGLGKATGAPAVLACTSGTAAANYAPAVIEAWEARVPLLVLTADRPPELREIGAGQTIDQLSLYGSAAKWFFDVDDHPASPARVRWLRQLACRAFWTAVSDRPGPVHLNFALREPLLPDGELPAEEIVPGRAGGRPWVTRPRPALSLSETAVSGLEEELRSRVSAVIVAGRSERDPSLGDALAAFAERAKIPLLADPLSGARRGDAAVAHYDALLRDPAWASSHVPELVLRVGDLPTSKPLRAWLADAPDALQIAVDPEGAWQDPSGVVGTVVAADPRALVDALAKKVTRRMSEWLDDWREADRAAAGAIASIVGPSGLTEPRVAAELGAGLPSNACLVVASSMPIRDVETFFPVRSAPFQVLSNRGANGIDGTVSTAFGVALGTRGPVVLLIGDVALAHDVGGLLAASRSGARVVIVLIDNDGGGIFNFLPVASGAGAEFEPHVATPHGLDFAAAAAFYGLEYERAQDVESFREALGRALASDRSAIVCVRTDREENVALHRRVWESVRAAT